MERDLLTFIRGCVASQALVQPGLLLVGSTDRACAAVACECCSRLDVPVLSLADDPLTSRNKAGVAAHECGVALPAPNPTAHIIFTSGSSGDPKAVFCHHRGSLLSHASQGRPRLGPTCLSSVSICVYCTTTHYCSASFNRGPRYHGETVSSEGDAVDCTRQGAHPPIGQ